MSLFSPKDEPTTTPKLGNRTHAGVTTTEWIDQHPELKAQVWIHIASGTSGTQIHAWLQTKGYPYERPSFSDYVRKAMGNPRKKHKRATSR